MIKEEIFVIFNHAQERGINDASNKQEKEVLYKARCLSNELNFLLQQADYDKLEEVANLSGWISGVAKCFNVKDEELYCYRVLIQFCRKSSLLKDNDRNQKFYLEELEKIAASAESEFYKNKSNKNIARIAAMAFNEAAIVIFEQVDISEELLSQADRNLNNAERMRKCSRDSFGTAFDFRTRSLYYRHLFTNKHDELALKNAWGCVYKTLKIFEKSDVSEQSHEFVFALVGECIEIIKLGERYYKNKIKASLLSRMNRQHKNKIDWQIIEDAKLEKIWDTIKSNYLVFGYDEIPEWATEESYRQELDNYIPDSKSVKETLNKIRKISLRIGVSKARIESIIINEFSKLGNSTALWYGVDNAIDVIIEKTNSYQNSELTQVLSYAIREYCYEQWSNSERFSEFVGVFGNLVCYASKKLGCANLADIFKENIDKIEMNVDLVARNMAIDFLSIGDKEAATWAFRNLFSIDLYIIPPILDDIKEFGYSIDSLVIFHGLRGSGVVLLTGKELNFFINHNLDGRRLTAYNYSLTDDKENAFVAAMQTGQDRKIWMRIVDRISLELRDIGFWIAENIPSGDKRILLVAGLGYYSFFPTFLISIDDDKRLADLYTVINRSRLSCINDKKYYDQSQWESINLACCSELPTYLNFPDLPGAEKECKNIKNLSWLKRFEKYHCSVSDVISFLQSSAIFHFSGHGKAPQLDYPPELVTITGTVGLKEIEELKNLDVPMVTLSCCCASSNFSTLDIFGLDEYLIEKGVGVCISARWPVLDENTSSFMIEFYKGYVDRVAGGKSGIVAAVESYREVQLNAKRDEFSKKHTNMALEWSSFIITI